MIDILFSCLKIYIVIGHFHDVRKSNFQNWIYLITNSGGFYIANFTTLKVISLEK